MPQKLRSLKGVGEKTEKLFEKLEIYNTWDLLHYFPKDYEAYEAPADIADLKAETVQTVSASVCRGIYMIPGRNKQICGTTVSDGTGELDLIWFNASYLRNTLKKGSRFVFRGKVVQKQKNSFQMVQPQIFTPAAYHEVMHSLQPVYGLTKGLTSKTIAKVVRQILEEGVLEKEFLPENIKERYSLADINYAIQTIHFPSDRNELIKARRRIVFDEFFCFVLSVRMLKDKTDRIENVFPVKRTWITEEIIESLPYQLTKAQMTAWHEIERDLAGKAMMSRLVQGDVGSGKTILAFLAMILAAENSYQAALMAPTEVLAKQHYEGFLMLLKENGLTFRTALLTGSATAKEKRKLYEDISSGEISVIIGTHALIQEQVEYQKLALVVIDEQHRFGVKQREELLNRGKVPNVMVMSATPIPRTLAMIIYGDLDISVIDELPARRLPVKNCVVDVSYRPKAFSFIERQIREGRQAYVICPMVEESEGLEAENVLDYTKKLKNTFSADITIQSLHGRMKPKEKNAVMESFAEGDIDILVSTTVVEVGVNVPNATVMMVENAERFGLSQLHQLRGRVGRGEHQSYCIFIQGSKEETTAKRLEILNKSNDGFYIAEEDLKLRGPGDLFGVRQNGMMEFKAGDIYNDADILKLAGEAAGDILALDPMLELEQNALLREEIENRMRIIGETPVL